MGHRINDPEWPFFLQTKIAKTLKYVPPLRKTAQKEQFGCMSRYQTSIIPEEEENSHLLVEYNCDIVIYFS